MHFKGCNASGDVDLQASGFKLIAIANLIGMPVVNCTVGIFLAHSPEETA